ncbi:hypothetical protein OL548_22075 [Lysinibacillus sp. MHQ-1]|nr:hypothetical protein OL548_22075 [Lysinibacillus sp. MHQ-1]
MEKDEFLLIIDKWMVKLTMMWMVKKSRESIYDRNMDNQHPSKLSTIMDVWNDSQLFAQVMKSVNREGDRGNLTVMPRTLGMR